MPKSKPLIVDCPIKYQAGIFSYINKSEITNSDLGMKVPTNLTFIEILIIVLRI